MHVGHSESLLNGTIVSNSPGMYEMYNITHLPRTACIVEPVSKKPFLYCIIADMGVKETRGSQWSILTDRQTTQPVPCILTCKHRP